LPDNFKYSKANTTVKEFKEVNRKRMKTYITSFWQTATYRTSHLSSRAISIGNRGRLLTSEFSRCKLTDPFSDASGAK